jgi:hypothetical protein
MNGWMEMDGLFATTSKQAITTTTTTTTSKRNKTKQNKNCINCIFHTIGSTKPKHHFNNTQTQTHNHVLGRFR